MQEIPEAVDERMANGKGTKKAIVIQDPAEDVVDPGTDESEPVKPRDADELDEDGSRRIAAGLPADASTTESPGRPSRLDQAKRPSNPSTDDIEHHLGRIKVKGDPEMMYTLNFDETESAIASNISHFQKEGLFNDKSVK